MKRKAVSILLGIGMAMTVCAGSAQAKTYGIDIGDGKTLQVTVLDDGTKSVESRQEIAKSRGDTLEAGKTERAQEAAEECSIVLDTGKTECVQEAIGEYKITQDRPGISQEAVDEEYTYTVEGNYQESEEKIKEYQECGIGYDEKSGCYTWEGTQIFWLMDEDGSMYQNGSKEAKEGKIYVLVTRKEDGSVKEAKKITAEEVLKERVLRDEKKAQREEQR